MKIEINVVDISKLTAVRKYEKAEDD